MRILVTGGLGFIGSAVVRLIVNETNHDVVNLDKIGYASTESSLAEIQKSPRYSFHRCDLAEPEVLERIVRAEQPDWVLHLAAESHVDRSIDSPRPFLESNIVGTFNLLEACRSVGSVKRLLHVSTDEVFGSLPLDSSRFDESTRYSPRSPYSASKAAADHLVRAWAETYNMPCIVTNCSNNFGPYQFPEKMIPVMIIKAWRGEPLPVYGNGSNVRDWLHVNDHARALLRVLERGEIGDTYMIGGGNEYSNLDVVQHVCDLVTERSSDSMDRRELIEFVLDRPGHDLRYAVDDSHIRQQLEWEPAYDFRSGLADTVDWYLANGWWWQPLLRQSGGGTRIGLEGAAK